MNKITFAERLKEARKNARLTQQQLADIVGRTKSAVSRWESGENTPQLFDLVKIEKAVGVPGQVLMYGTEKITETTLSEINRISSRLNEQRQKNVLNFSKAQLQEQNQEIEEEKVIALDKKNSNNTDIDDDGIDWNEWVAFDGKPMTDHDKQILKDYFGDELKD
uniref:helix-turn-helix domain-containing protein n=1 Tax=Lactococcus garvieae TaxID=1363 RepID=UPI00359C9C0D